MIVSSGVKCNAAVVRSVEKRSILASVAFTITSDDLLVINLLTECSEVSVVSVREKCILGVAKTVVCVMLMTSYKGIDDKNDVIALTAVE